MARVTVLALPGYISTILLLQVALAIAVALSIAVALYRRARPGRAAAANVRPTGTEAACAGLRAFRVSRRDYEDGGPSKGVSIGANGRGVPFHQSLDQARPATPAKAGRNW